MLLYLVEAVILENNNDEVVLLVAQSGPLNGQRWALRDSMLIGREISCDIVIPDRQVSRQHARFTQSSNGVFIEDLGSKNGTYLNGSLIKATTQLHDGDTVQIALAQKIVFLSSDATVPLEIDYQGLSARQTSLDNKVASQIEEELMTSHGPMNRLYLDNRSHRVWIRIPQPEVSNATSKTNKNIQEIELNPPLSASQFRMLETLYDHQGQIVSRQEMIAQVWGVEEAVGVSDQALDALTRRLRDRLASVDPTHVFIITVRGHGLRLDNPLIPQETRASV